MPVDISAYSKKDPIEAEGDQIEGVVEFDAEPTAKSLPLNVVFCIDKSSSMSGQKIKTARKGLENAVKKLDSGDTFAVVAFSGSAKQVVQPTEASDASQHYSTIRGIKSGGGTSIMSGLKKAESMLSEIQNGGLSSMISGDRNKTITWIILITDGQASLDEEYIIQNFGQQGIPVHTAGIGNYDQRVIQTVAEKSRGEWRDVGKAEKLGQFFSNKLSEARNVAGLDPELTIEPSPVSKINNVHYTLGEKQSTDDPDRQQDKVVVPLTDITAENEPTVRIDLFVDAEPQPEGARLLDVELSTNSQTVRDKIVAEVAVPFVAEEENEDGGSKDGIVVGEIVDTLLEEGASAAESELDDYRTDDDVSDATIAELEQKIDENKTTAGQKSARDDAATLLGELDDEE